ncbi:MAG: PilZ domain-containing protein [Deltaproteobacteria bacterium]|nr:PilZ domain-containing protein [Deltaproteobacteria bacterium]
MGNGKENGPSKGQGVGKDSWVDFRRKVSQVPQDKRRHPRLEFHCPARLQGIKTVCRVTDISMGGVFLEVDSTSGLELGQTLTLVLKLPTEYEPTKLTVQVANIRERGVGLRFTNLNSRTRQTIRFCFDTFKDTIPLR